PSTTRAIPLGRGVDLARAGVGDRCPRPSGRAGGHPRLAAPRRLGGPGLDRAARRRGVTVAAGRPGRRARRSRRRGGPMTPGKLDIEKLFAARLYAARVRPYLATALFALHTVESRRVPTMAVDRHWRCYVSPLFVDRTPLEELAGVWVHEVSHLLRDHHGRSDRIALARGLTG